MKDDLLKSRLTLLHKNYLSGLFTFTFLCFPIGYLIYRDTHQLSAIVWLGSIIALCIAFYVHFRFFRKESNDRTQHNANITTLKCTLHGLAYSACAPLFLSDVSLPTFCFIIIAYAGIVAASTLMLSMYMPTFCGSTYPIATTLIIAVLQSDEVVFRWLAFPIIIYTLVMTVFAINIKKSVNKSITLRYENEDLVSELRLALTQTDEANRAKSIFLASASHDLRQPLHALGLLIETLGSTTLSPQQNELHNHMMSSVESTRGMLDSLLNISKLDAGAISSQPEPFFIQTIFNKLEKEIAPRADERGLIYRTRETIAAAHSDIIIVELIMRNLIANAIRYTKEGGVLVACRNKKNNKLVIEIWDTGIGIPEHERQSIFTPFHQLDNPERNSTKGFGLGLAISQGLAKTIDSEILVKSIPNRGSVFRFELERSNANIIEDIAVDVIPVQFKGKLILIIDDDERVRASMQSVMQSWACESIVCESAAEALKQIEGKRIDIMLVDYRLKGGLTGRHAIAEVRKKQNKNIPAIIITGDTAAERIQEAQAVDAMLMHKPASTHQLQLMMKQILK